jgi:hypothetical protein
MYARMWGGLLQDTVSPLGDMVHLFIDYYNSDLLWSNNLTLFVTQSLIGSFDFSEVFYIVCNNLT